MSISGDGKVIVAATKEVAVRWAETKQFWQDAKSREFEHKFLDDLFASVDEAAPVFDQLDKLVNRIREDCE